ncbi:hypothetical protein ACFLYU_05405, partial [Candidatus Dependentiae bacterium]
YTIKHVFENCKALNCIQAGFDQTNCQFNVFENCLALQTTNDTVTERAVGFSSNDGTGTLFKECVAEGTTKTDSYFDKGPVGFLLTGSEAESKIINCIANSTLESGTSALAYGIFIEPTFTGTDLKDSYNHGHSIYGVSWSPCGRYLAICGANGTDDYELRIMRFDGSTLSPIAGYDHEVDNLFWTVDWSPCGQYVAVGGRDGVGNFDVRVLSFDGSSLSLIDSYNHGTVDIFSVNWSPSGEYLAIGGNPSSSINFRIFRFDGTSLDLVVDYTHISSGDAVRGVSWSPSGKYIALGGSSNDLEIVQFDGKNVSSVDTYDHGALILAVAWSPTEKYVGLSGQSSSGADIRVFEFDGSVLTKLADFLHSDNVRGIKWSQVVNYLAIVGDNPSDTYDLRILEFTGTSLTEVASYDNKSIDTYDVDWSPSSLYLAIGSVNAADGNKVRVFEVMYAPENCLLDSNEVCNTSGTTFQGLGIGGSGDNLYVRNIGFANDVNFNKAVTNTFGLSLLESGAKKFDNLWSPPYVN